MKASLYNAIFRDGGRTYLYNSRRRGLFAIEPAVGDALRKLECGSEGWATELPSDYYDRLCSSGCVIPDDRDEIQELTDERTRANELRNVLSLTVAPTLDCNFACPDRFEGQERPDKTRISHDTMRSAVGFLNAQVAASAGRLKSLWIEWFGGEPLLAFHEIIDMTSMLKDEVVAPNALEYGASITTNGYGLTLKVAEKLRELSVLSAQVTLDGYSAFHNSRRPLKNGNGTFDRIVSNIEAVCDVIPIVVRVNLSPASRDGFGALLEELDERGVLTKVRLYTAMTKGDGPNCYQSIGPFVKDEAQLEEYAAAHGMTLHQYPRSVRMFCSATTWDNWVLTPGGDLHKCWETIMDSSLAVGNVHSSEFTEQLKWWLTWNPLDYEKCRACGVLPLCMGGCPHDALVRGAGEPWCDPVRESMQAKVLATARRIRDAKFAAEPERA